MLPNSGKIKRDKNGIRILDNIKTIPATTVERLDVWDKTNGRCFYCGKKLQTKYYHKRNYMTIDHIIPLSKDGPDTLDNKVPSCKSCNFLKGDMELILPAPAPDSEAGGV